LERIGFVGLGAMGGPLAGYLVKNGFETRVFDLNPAALKILTDQGAISAPDVKFVAENSDIVFTCLPNSPEVRHVVLDPGGILEHLVDGGMIVDLSTIDPAITDEISRAVIEKGRAFADSPIGRTVDLAAKGEALFMVGATGNDFGRLQPVLSAMGSTVRHCGDPGSGIRTKLVNNFASIAIAQVNAEAIALSQAFGLDLAETLETVNGTTATNGHLARLWPAKVFAGDIEPGFKISLAAKDLGLVVEAAKTAGVPVFAGAAARQALMLACNTGDYANKDFSALADVACAHAGLKPPRF
jgi:4-hydroxybutyrate dehydrogenase/sulfolactaldehyde 3-reductase